MASEKQFAVVTTGGKQYRMSAGDRVLVELLPGDTGETIEINTINLVGGPDQEAIIGTPYVPEAKITAKILGVERGPKKTVFKKRRRKGYRLKQGHRQNHTKLLIEEISM